MANIGQAAIKIYFQQTDHYFSESKGTLIKVADMHPTHAANVAARLLREHAHWAIERDGVASRTPRWMMQTPLWNALVNRAIED